VLDSAVAGMAPERRQVVRHRERAQRHDDQVVEHDPPAGDEAPQLVERVPREGRRPTALGVQRVALDVGEHRHHEEDPGEQVRDRGQAEGQVGDDPERDVDRGADRADGDGVDRRRADHAHKASLDQGEQRPEKIAQRLEPGEPGEQPRSHRSLAR
jgi:hypothetical protein